MFITFYKFYATDMHAFMFFRQVIPVLPAIMIRRECYDAGFRYDASLFRGDDYDFVLRLSEKFAFYYMNENLYKYRRHNSNITNLQTGMEQGEIKVLSRFTDEEIAERINRSNFSDMDKQLLIAKVFIKMKKFGKAREILEVSDKKYKSEIISFYLGNCSYQSENYMDAVIYYQEAVEINPKMAEAYNNMGCAYMGLGDNKKAFEAFTQAHHIRKDYNDSVYNIKQLSNGEKEYKLTMRELRKSLMVYN